MKKDYDKFFLFEDCLIKIVIFLIVIFLYIQIEGGL